MPGKQPRKRQPRNGNHRWQNPPKTKPMDNLYLNSSIPRHPIPQPKAVEEKVQGNSFDGLCPSQRPT